MRTVLLTIAVLTCCCSCSREAKVLESHSFIASGSESVFDQTRRHFVIEYDSLEFGMFVTAIAGVAQTRRAYWLYYINSEPINFSSDRYFPDPGDTIQWRLVSVY